MTIEIQSIYQDTIKFAAERHQEQKIPGTNLSYMIHLSNVAMEILIASFQSNNFDTPFAIRVALLHDTLEDTETEWEDLQAEFGDEVAFGVESLTKNETLPKEEQMIDSLKRIKKLKKEVWAIKLADRITNLQ